MIWIVLCDSAPREGTGNILYIVSSYKREEKSIFGRTPLPKLFSDKLFFGGFTYRLPCVSR